MTTPEPAPPPRSPGALTAFVLALRFVTELLLVGGAAWAASTRPTAVVLAVAAGILAALAVAAVWGVAIAPASRRRLADPLRLAVEIALFVAVAVGLAAVDHVPAAVVLAVLGSATAVGVRFVDRGERTARPDDGRTGDVPSDAPTDVPSGDGPTPTGGAQLRRPRGPGRGRRTR
jgi:hypothetical protein